MKFTINALDKQILTSRLAAVLKKDAHSALSGSYSVRSLYFDDLHDNAVVDKLTGVRYREKFRIRTYGESVAVIRLEKKVKNNNLGYKESALLTPDECRRLLKHDFDFLKTKPETVCQQLYIKMRTGLFRPKTIVQYEREAYVWEPGRIRITIDSNLRTGLNSTEFLDYTIPLVPTAPGSSVLEIKYDDFLPAHISTLLQLESRRQAAISKYILCRKYG